MVTTAPSALPRSPKGNFGRRMSGRGERGSVAFVSVLLEIFREERMKEAVFPSFVSYQQFLLLEAREQFRGLFHVAGRSEFFSGVRYLDEQLSLLLRRRPELLSEDRLP